MPPCKKAPVGKRHWVRPPPPGGAPQNNARGPALEALTSMRHGSCCHASCLVVRVANRDGLPLRGSTTGVFACAPHPPHPTRRGAATGARGFALSSGPPSFYRSRGPGRQPRHWTGRVPLCVPRHAARGRAGRGQGLSLSSMPNAMRPRARAAAAWESGKKKKKKKLAPPQNHPFYPPFFHSLSMLILRTSTLAAAALTLLAMAGDAQGELRERERGRERELSPPPPIHAPFSLSWIPKREAQSGPHLNAHHAPHHLHHLAHMHQPTARPRSRPSRTACAWAPASPCLARPAARRRTLAAPSPARRCRPTWPHWWRRARSPTSAACPCGPSSPRAARAMGTCWPCWRAWASCPLAPTRRPPSLA